MKIYIEYEIPTTSGCKDIRGAFKYTPQEAEDFCKNLERIGCKIRIVNNEP